MRQINSLLNWVDSQLTWRRLYYFTPNDFFASYAAQTFYRSYKPGVDAARLDWQWSELSQISLMTVVVTSATLTQLPASQRVLIGVKHLI
jgi:hypothetical protein